METARGRERRDGGMEGWREREKERRRGEPRGEGIRGGGGDTPPVAAVRGRAVSLPTP
jgi:hypothetical protein